MSFVLSLSPFLFYVRVETLVYTLRRIPRIASNRKCSIIPKV